MWVLTPILPIRSTMPAKVESTPALPGLSPVGGKAVIARLAALSSELAAEQAQVARLQGAIKYTVDSDLLFSPGGWQMSARGKQVIGTMAAKLAPTQQ